MKKSFTILLFTGLVLIIMLLSAYITRNQWVGYLIKQEVFDKSKGKVSLSFKQIELDIFHEHLSLTEPVLDYKDVFINTKDSVQLVQSSFKKLSISKISFWDFIQNKQIICEKLLLEKPDFVLHQPDSIRLKTAPSFDPGSVLSILEAQQISHVGIQFLIKKIQIDLGKIKLVQNQSKNEHGSTEYKISIKNLGTPLDKETPDSLNVVRYDQLEIRLHKLHRYSVKGNLNLKIDSAYYNSQHKHFIVQGFHFSTLKKGKQKQPKVNMQINWIDFIGLHLNELNPQAKEIHFRKLKLIGGTITWQQTPLEKSKKRKTWSNAIKSYTGIVLDTLIGKHIHLFQLNQHEDTLLRMKRMNFDFNKIKLTRAFFKNPFQNLQYDDLLFRAQSWFYQDTDRNWNLIGEKIAYQQKGQVLSIEIPQWTKPEHHKTLFRANKITAKNFSLKKLQKNRNQQLRLILDHAFIDFNLDSLKSTPRQSKSSIRLQSLKLQQLLIKQSKMQLESKQSRINFDGLNLYLDGFKSDQLFADNPGLVYDTISFKAQKGTFDSDSSHQHASAKNLQFQNKKLSLKNFIYLHDSVQLEKSLRIPATSITHLNLNALLFHHKILAGGAYFYKPHLRLNRNDSLSVVDTSQFIKQTIDRLPLKIYCAYVRIRKGNISYRANSVSGGDSLFFQSDMDLKWHRFRWGYGNTTLSKPMKWDFKLYHTRFVKGRIYGSISEMNGNSSENRLNIQDLTFNKQGMSTKLFHVSLPEIDFKKIDLPTLFSSDTLAFDTLTIQNARITLPLPQFGQINASSGLPKWVLSYDGLLLNHANFTFTKESTGSFTKIEGKQLHLFYHPYLRHPFQRVNDASNLLSNWDISLGKIILTDTLKNFKMVADRIELQSKANQLSVRRLVGSNFANGISAASLSGLYQHFQFEKIQLNGLNLNGTKDYQLNIKTVSIPRLWYNFINEQNQQNKSKTFLGSINLPSNFTFLNRIHIDSTHFAEVNLSYQYQHRTKIIQADKLKVFTRNIQLVRADEIATKTPYLFSTMMIDLNGKRIISGDSLYRFQTRDIRIDLPNRQIRLDSLSIIPLLGRKDFFKKSINQTDRVTVYGRSVSFNNFDLNQIVQRQRFDLGSLQFDHFNMLFQRDKSYPLADVVKPLPIESLQRIPIQFYVDSIQLRNSQLSYYEYNAKSRQPGIFFIDNFNLHFLNVTNDLAHIDSTLVLKVHGGGKMMKQSDLNFALVMPYFAPRHQFWFSAHIGPVDFSQFNSLTQNTTGIGIVSGKGNVEIPFVTGNDEFAKGSMYFLYRNLKLRLYNRKKAKMNKGIGSPFVNFMLNNLMIRSNNTRFLKHPRKGIIYYERDPRKSFINYIWKSNLSGILSTLGFNNKQQRQVKREEKKASRHEK